MRLACPAAVADGHLALADHGVNGFSFGALEREAKVSFPGVGHGFAGVAAPRFAIGVAGEDGGFEARYVAFVEPSGGCGHDFVAVVEHEGVFVGVAEVVVGDD